LSPATEGRWVLGTRGKVASRDIRDHFHYLNDRLLPHAAALKMFARGGETFFSVVWKSTYLYAGTGPLLDAESLTGVATLGAGMDFDIYQVNEDDQVHSFSPAA